jgi:hypothetical protein
MTLFRIFLVLMLLLLVGCATTGKYGQDLGYQPCKGAEREHTSEVEKVDINELTYEYDENVSKSFSGIQSAHLNGAELTLTAIQKSQYEQYSAPIVVDLYKTKYKAQPIKGFLYALITVGIYPVFWPSDFLHYTFGCTEKTISSSKSDLLRKVKTGKTEWRDTNNRHKFLVSGFDRDYEFGSYQFELMEYGSTRLFLIDLTKAILATNLTGSTNLKITCIDCDLLGPEEQKLYKDTKKTIELTYDFRSIKESLSIKKAIQDKTEKENIRIRAIREKEIAIQEQKDNLNAQKERNGAPISRFKEQCMQLGFKVGTQDFGNCVLELNDAK